MLQPDDAVFQSNIASGRPRPPDRHARISPRAGWTRTAARRCQRLERDGEAAGRFDRLQGDGPR
jgi:hypothetical protein